MKDATSTQGSRPLFIDLSHHSIRAYRSWINLSLLNAFHMKNAIKKACQTIGIGVNRHRPVTAITHISVPGDSSLWINFRQGHHLPIRTF